MRPKFRLITIFLFCLVSILLLNLMTRRCPSTITVVEYPITRTTLAVDDANVATPSPTTTEAACITPIASATSNSRPIPTPSTTNSTTTATPTSTTPNTTPKTNSTTPTTSTEGTTTNSTTASSPAKPKPTRAAIKRKFHSPIDCTPYEGLDRRVYTYFTPMPDIQSQGQDILEEWRISWEYNCWEPIVLSEKDAQLHPKYSEWIQQLSKLPTVNNPTYEISCYIRYIALAVVGGGIMVDFDLINFRYRPDDFFGQQPFPKRFTGYENSVPSMVYGNASEFERVVDYMANYTLGPHNEFNGKPHISDMHIIVDMRAKKLMETADSPIFSRKMFHLSTQATLSSREATGISDLSKIDLARLINHLKAA